MSDDAAVHRSLLATVGSVVVFAATVEAAGLPAAILLSVLLSSSATPATSWRRRLLTATGSAVSITWLLVQLLGLSLPVLPRPLP